MNIFLDFIPMGVHMIFDPFTFVCVLWIIVLLVITWVHREERIYPIYLEEDTMEAIPEPTVTDWVGMIGEIRPGIPPASSRSIPTNPRLTVWDR